MKSTEIILGKIYRHKTSSIGYAHAISLLPPKKGENTTNKILVKCAWASDPKFMVYQHKYFRPADLTKYIVNGEQA